jgi:hypothetical protein
MPWANQEECPFRAVVFPLSVAPGLPMKPTGLPKTVICTSSILLEDGPLQKTETWLLSPFSLPLLVRAEFLSQPSLSLKLCKFPHASRNYSIVKTQISLLTEFRYRYTRLHGATFQKTITNFMELRCSWEATSCAATQELPNILHNRKFITVINGPPLVPVLSQINPVHSTLSSEDNNMKFLIRLL